MLYMYAYSCRQPAHWLAFITASCNSSCLLRIVLVDFLPTSLYQGLWAASLAPGEELFTAKAQS